MSDDENHKLSMGVGSSNEESVIQHITVTSLSLKNMFTVTSFNIFKEHVSKCRKACEDEIKIDLVMIRSDGNDHSSTKVYTKFKWKNIYVWVC